MWAAEAVADEIGLHVHYYKIVPVLQLHFVIVSLVIWKKSQYTLVLGM